MTRILRAVFARPEAFLVLGVLGWFAVALMNVDQDEPQLTQEDYEYLAESQVGMEQQL